jgi:hypothetical protein
MVVARIRSQISWKYFYLIMHQFVVCEEASFIEMHIHDGDTKCECH